MKPFTIPLAVLIVWTVPPIPWLVPLPLVLLGITLGALMSMLRCRASGTEST